MTKALVTGGTGFVGSHVVRRVVSEGLAVRCLVRPGSKRLNLNGLSVEFAEGDLLNRPSLKRAVAGCQMLFHVAADYRIWARHPDELFKTNVDGSRALLEEAVEAGMQRIVFTSSVAAVGRPHGNTVPHPGPSPSEGRGDLKKIPLPSPRDRELKEARPSSLNALEGWRERLGEGWSVGTEDLDPTPKQLVGPYKRSKFAADLLAREFAQRGAPVVIVNPSAPIGSRDIKPTPTGKMIVDFLNRRMPGFVDTGMNFVDVEDVAAGHWLAAQKGKVGERYILGNQNMTLKQFLELLAGVAKLPAPRWKIPYSVAWMAGAVSTGLSYVTGKEPQIPLDGVRMAHETMYYDASKAIKTLGLPQTPVRNAIEKAVSWFRENGYVR